MPPRAKPSSLQRFLGLSSRVMLVLNVAGLVLLGVLLAVLRGYLLRAFAQYHEQFQVELPALTVRVLAVPGWVWLALCGAASAGLVVKEWRVKNKAVTLAIELAVALLVGLFLVAYVLAIGLAIARLYTTVAGGAGGRGF